VKKTNKRADGTEEVLEGDPEELRKYEDLHKPQDQVPITESPNKPGILHGSEVDGTPLTEAEIGMIRFLRTFKIPEVKTQPLPFEPYRDWPQYPQGPIWIVSCSLCHRVDCNGGCYLKFQQPWYTITYTTTGDKIEMKQPEQASLLLKQDGTSEMSHSLADFLMGRATIECKTNGN
jgi:hypothetical protein